VTATIDLRVNGEAVSIAGDGSAALLHVLREQLGLRAVRYGCGAEACGACAVLLDGTPVRSCTLPLERAAGREIVTPEGLGSQAKPHPLQVAFVAEQAGQCGYCLSGILIAAAALLARDPDPSRAAIAAALDTHLCRCGAHNRIIRAVQSAARAMREATA
jgi:nicotinate dehydrogenase subunit A